MICVLSSNAQSQREKTIRTKINKDFEKNISKCHFSVDIVTSFNDKKEFWSICNLENGNRVLEIHSHKEDTFYQEVYFEKKGELMYAQIVENYHPENHFTQMLWSCEFYIKNREIISLTSLGHGKTEDEEWNPDIIFTMHKKRLNELVHVKK